ncbi:MAG TPA: nucleoside triphosphate pyrophosphohydrolase [Firmicutes bacterium]|jgi:tetrapyrrole methylase family protein/MazG family protein|nr:nucleoside triphosphate pyrophosphohydrolase [Bacillota bacterium]HAW72113.1 nucleoside triphosphate pyrophosphohydrolase [Bacillota bacterium]HAZ21163.1 nucleoside triphosphate pyrophosphohydrolase [Bacillota bacterium]HBE05812.1 nucleoside triphosphate pyrophosphohydrolase [Bacillota bacterium]HBG44920.1 nucleoside triphosphate pyrophosphohydrolase [Bacillota bacterium]
MDHDELSPFQRLVTIMGQLRAPEGGCPWDRQQSLASLRPYVLEEAYEVVQALDRGDYANLCEELGDLLLQIVFQAQIAQESGAFDIDDVCNGIADKLIRRHPHVFFNDHEQVKVDDAAGVVVNWEKIKAAEKGKTEPSILDSIPAALPALMRAYKLQERAARVGFDWPDVRGALVKVDEEMGEFRELIPDDHLEAPEKSDRASADQRLTEEFGDLLFALVNVSRYLGIDPEVALLGTARKFAWRFAQIEEGARKEGRKMEEMTLEEMDRYWDAAKAKKG